MGLDQYAYVAARAGQRKEFDNSAVYLDGKFVSNTVQEPREIAYWRKHPTMQGWMEKRWIEKNYPGIPQDSNKFDYPFNGVELELTWEDIDRLENDIKNGGMSKLNTTGFFFGNPSDSIYYENDLQFIKDAKAELFLGLKVFYNSSW